MTSGHTRSTAYRFILLMGMVSLFGDVTYEGARSVTGPYLASMGATAAVVGFVAGLGQFLGYGLRLVSGLLADRSERYWLIAIAGYAMILCIPLLAFVGSWQLAVILLLAERLGKAVRTPARDAILSHASRKIGRGMGFGLHEALDQVGAFAGPLIFTAALALGGGYRSGFAMTLVPCAVMMGFLFLARSRVPTPSSLEADDGPRSTGEGKSFPPFFWSYLLFTGVSAAGLAGFPLIAYHVKVAGLASDALIPLLYAAAMAVDGVAALAVGRLYDRTGFASLLAAPLFTLPIGFLAFLGSFPLVVAGILLWGSAMAVHETIMRAAVADLTPLGRRGYAYGIFNTVYGFSLFAGTSLMGYLYDRSILAVAWAPALLSLASLPLFFRFRRVSAVNGI